MSEGLISYGKIRSYFSANNREVEFCPLRFVLEDFRCSSKRRNCKSVPRYDDLSFTKYVSGNKITHTSRGSKFIPCIQNRSFQIVFLKKLSYYYNIMVFLIIFVTLIIYKKLSTRLIEYHFDPLHNPLILPPSCTRNKYDLVTKYSTLSSRWGRGRFDLASKSFLRLTPRIS